MTGCESATLIRGCDCNNDTLITLRMFILIRRFNIKFFHLAEQCGFMDFQFFGGVLAVLRLSGRRPFQNQPTPVSPLGSVGNETIPAHCPANLFYQFPFSFRGSFLSPITEHFKKICDEPHDFVRGQNFSGGPPKQCI